MNETNLMTKTLFILGLAGTLALPLCAQVQYSAGLPGSVLLTAVPTILEGSGGGANCLTNFTIGTTNATIGPVNLANAKYITWELTGQATNTTTTITVMFNLFTDMTATNWYQTASNAVLTGQRVMTCPLTTGLRTVSTNFEVDCYQYMVPLYLTNASQCVSNLSLRYGIKPGY